MQLKIQHYKTKYRINSVFKQKIKKERNNYQRKEKMQEKKTSANINSRKVLKI